MIAPRTVRDTAGKGLADLVMEYETDLISRGLVKKHVHVPSLQLHSEIAKLPWISPEGVVAQHSAQNSGVSGPVVSLPDILQQLKMLAQATGTDGVRHDLALSVTSGQIVKMAARAGIEPATK